jgi:hypothetical protein
MKDSWRGKNIDLLQLGNRILQFFISKGFKAVLKIKRNKQIITVFPQQSHGILDKINVVISGKPEDFTVEFVPGSFSRSLLLHTPFLSLFFGGYLLKKGLESFEKIDALEKEFWKYVDETIWLLQSLN